MVSITGQMGENMKAGGTKESSMVWVHISIVLNNQ